MNTCHNLPVLFSKFIKYNESGRRSKKDGSKIKIQSTKNYKFTLKLLKEFGLKTKFELQVPLLFGENKRALKSNQRYWKRLYNGFTNFLYDEKKHHDNYVGQNIKNIRTFFNWVNNYLCINTGKSFRSFYIRSEQIPIITLSNQQLLFLIYNREFESLLAPSLVRSKNMFVFGCLTGLRFSDLSKIQKTDLQERDGNMYLEVLSSKTNVQSKIKLPVEAIMILKKLTMRGKMLLPSISLFCFNRNIKKIGLLAEWTNPVVKVRHRRGKAVICKNKGGENYRFCDLLSSHTMRRTAITLLLTQGVPELLVRKFSGHAPNSKAFFRYVDLAQSYMDNETDKAFNKLLKNPYEKS